jgi:cellulose synthase (UDP-forming)
MSAPGADWRRTAVDWQPLTHSWRTRLLRVLLVVNVVLAARYLSWLVAPGRAAQPLLYGLLLAAELFNMVQGAGFWWTVSRTKRPLRSAGPHQAAVRDELGVDVLIPTYNEPVEVVEPTIEAATRLRGADVRVALLDDGARPEMEAMAKRQGVRYVTRPSHEGAKAGNINWALERTDAPFVAVLDCDHVPEPSFLEACLAQFDDDVAFVQTPQYYANWRRGGLAEATWSQQALFFGSIAPGRDALGAMFCCGTNFVARRAALEQVGGFSPDSLTEDFELSIRLHELGWQSRYLPEVLASGLGPEDMGSYASQQLRWARGCLASLPAIVRAELPFRLRLQYLLSAGYWLTGWTLLVYMTFPVVRILTGVQPVDVRSANEFLVYWAPYFVASMTTVALVARGRYTYSAFALMAASFWIHIVATVLTVLRRRGSFAVTPKRAVTGVQIRPVLPPLAAMAVLASVIIYGLARDQSPATVTNASFALVHLVVLASGVRFAFAAEPDQEVAVAATTPEAA